MSPHLRTVEAPIPRTSPGGAAGAGAPWGWWEMMLLVAAALVAYNSQLAAGPDPELHRLLFVDSALFANASSELALRVERPTKAGPVLEPTLPWEDASGYYYNTVVRVNATAVYLYYDCGPRGTSDLGLRFTCLAISADGGETFTKPSLGIAQINGSTANNVIWPLTDQHWSVFSHGVVFIDTNPNVDETERFKFLCFWGGDKATPPFVTGGLWVLGSADGIRFHPLSAAPSVTQKECNAKAFGSANLVAFWDSTLPEPSYVVYGRTSKARAATCGADHSQPCSCPIPAHDTKAIDSQRRAGRRVIHNLTDPHDWKAIYPPDFVTFDALDPPCFDIHTPTAAWWPHPPSGANHGEVLLAFPSVFAHKMFADHHENDGLVEVRLLASRDGVAAKYVPAANGRSPVLPLGQSGCTHLQPSIYPAGEMWCNRTSELAKGDFDSGKIWAVSGLIESSDGRTVSIYYGGNPASHGCDDNHQGPDFSSDNHCGADGLGKVGRAVYRRDGFTSIESGYHMWGNLPQFTTIQMVVPSPQALGGGGSADVFLELNLATSTVGHCKVGVLSKGASVAGFGLQDADPVSGDWLQARATWARGQRSGLRQLIGSSVQLQVEMVDMKLYSVTWVAGAAPPEASRLKNPGSTKTDDAIQFDIGWDDAPLAITPIVSSWHDTAQGSAGNPNHDAVYPPTEYDTVDALNARRRELRSPYARLFSETNLVYGWPNSNRTTVVGPSPLPPNTSDTCRTLFPTCSCCPRADCPCVAGQIAATTSWDFAALDIQVAALMENTALPHTNIMQFTGNVEPWWWFKGCNATVCPCGGGFADPSGVTIGMWHSRVLDWYTKGGMTDELGKYHHSGHFYKFGYLELMNEVDGHCNVFFGSTMLAKVRNYNRMYDSAAKILKKNHADTKLIGLCLGSRGTEQLWQTFLNQSEHAPGTPWPPDGVAYHAYASGASTTGWNGWARPLIDSAHGVIGESIASAKVIKAASPSTKIFMDEVGLILGCNPPFDMTATLGYGNLSSWWNLQSVVWSMFVGELATARVDMLGASQFIGWVAGPPGSPVGIPSADPAAGTPYQPQVTAGGNCAEMSLVSWVDGSFNARAWTMKMLIDAMGHEDKHVLATNFTKAPPPPKRAQCKQLTKTANVDMIGGNLCGFNMSGPGWPEPSFEACGAACCRNESCDHFETIEGDPPWTFASGGTCAGEAPCAKGGFCCYFKNSLTVPTPSSLYKNNSMISGTTTPSTMHVSGPPVYARAFAPAAGLAWPSGRKRAVLLANKDPVRTHAVAFDGLAGAEVWSVEHGKSGFGETPYATGGKAAADGTLALPPLGVALAFPVT